MLCRSGTKFSERLFSCCIDTLLKEDLVVFLPAPWTSDLADFPNCSLRTESSSEFSFCPHSEKVSSLRTNPPAGTGTSHLNYSAAN